MSGWVTAKNGMIVERGDLTTRIVTTYDEQGNVISTRPYTDDENAAADAAAAAAAQAEAQRQRAELAEAILDATTALMENAHEDGQPWVQPTGAHDAYPLDATATHKGKTWESTIPVNVWEPGVSGWREVVSEGYAAWVQPTGAHDAYNTGDRVSFEGQNYESTIDDNIWSPTDYPEGWTLIP